MRVLLPADLNGGPQQMLLAAGAAVVGLLIGSFLNVCIYRIPRDLSVVSPRSFCPGCERPISWFDNIPLLSYALLQGRCRSCHEAIPIRYAMVELLTAVAFGAVAYRYGLTASGCKWGLFESLLIVLFWTDVETWLLPDEFTLGGTAAAFLLALPVSVRGPIGEYVLGNLAPLWQSLLNAAAGGLLLAGPLWLTANVYGRLRKVDALGLGDVKLIMMIGSFLGLGLGLMALGLGAISGTLVGVPLALAARKSLSQFEVPFGAFLCSAAALLPLVISASEPSIRN